MLKIDSQLATQFAVLYCMARVALVVGKSIKITMHVNCFDPIWVMQSLLSFSSVNGLSGIKSNDEHPIVGN